MKRKNSFLGGIVAITFYVIAGLTVLRFNQMGEMKAGIFLAGVEIVLGTFFWINETTRAEGKGKGSKQMATPKRSLEERK